MPQLAPVGRFDGDVRHLPQVPIHDREEIELVDPVDQVHSAAPLPHTPLAPPSGPMPPVILSFAGMSLYDYCQGGYCGGGHPPDTTGAVGSSHYIQAINLAFAIFDKATGNRLAAFTERSLWSATNGGLCSTNPYGDPIVLYDQVADRWILTNFAFSDFENGPFYECIAVSQTGDPVSGGYYFYAIRTDQGQVPGSTLNDYPKLGVWNDGCLYMAANGYHFERYAGQVIFAINRNQMYRGVSANNSLAWLAGSANFSLFPATMLGYGPNLPSPSTPEYFVQESETEDAFNVRTLGPNACNAGGTISEARIVPHDTYSTVLTNIIPQPPPGDTNRLDSLNNRLMQWIQYRKVGGAESLWVNHTTFFSTENTSPQWGQIDVSGGVVHTNIVQQQIYQRDMSLFRWMGSLAVDRVGDMALCYSTSNAMVPNFPSIQCAGRLAGDPLNQLPQGETEYVAGAGSQTNDCNGPCHRWGDYSSTTVDPIDDCTFWHTNMFYNSQGNGNSGNYQTQIFAFKYPNCIPAQVSLRVSNSGGGTVTSNDGLIDCGTTCTHIYGYGAQVTLTARPDPGWDFTGWTGACSGTDTCQLTMNQNQSVTATFTLRQFNTLTVSVSGNGRVRSTDGGINCPGTCSFTYSRGVQVTLNGLPDPSWSFSGWTGACTGIGQCNVIMNDNLAVSAVFVEPGHGLQFNALTPCRVVDTRSSGPIQGGTAQSFNLPQLGCGIPSSAAAYSLNVTVVPRGRLGFLTIWPAGEAQPSVSTLNSPDGRVKANAAIVPAGSAGAVSVFVTNTTDVILDINGYFSTPAQQTLQFYPLTPCRIVDTRNNQSGGTLQAGVERDYAIAGTCGIPASAAAYSFNVTVVPPQGSLDYLTVWPQGGSQPIVSTLNDNTGTVVSNAAIVPAGSNHTTAFYAHNNNTDLLVDTNGYFAAPGTGGNSFYAPAPCRVYDSRSQGDGQPFQGTRIIDVVGSACQPPSNINAYVFSATVVPANGPLGYLTLWPDGSQQPVVSTLNARDGLVTSNMAIVPNNDGSIDAYASALTQLILDISGYFAP